MECPSAAISIPHREIAAAPLFAVMMVKTTIDDK